MNKVILSGNLTRDPERRETSTGKSVTSFTVACQRRFKNAEGGYDADFVSCVAWGSSADFVSKYFQKGSRIEVAGRIQTRTYDDKDGNRRYVTEVVADEVEFGGSSRNSGGGGYQKNDYQAPEDTFGAELDAFRKNGASAADSLDSGNTGFEPVEDPELPF